MSKEEFKAFIRTTRRYATLEHFGYEAAEEYFIIPSDADVGSWPRESALEKMESIPDFLRLRGAENKRFRITIEYDPEYPDVLFIYQQESEAEAEHDEGFKN